MLDNDKKVFNAFTILKDHRWVIKKRSFIIYDVLIISISFFLSYYIIALLPEPEMRISIGQITFESFITVLDDFFLFKPLKIILLFFICLLSTLYDKINFYFSRISNFSKNFNI